MVQRVAIAVVVVMCMAFEARAEKQTFDAVGVSVEVPASWLSEVKGSAVTITSKDKMAVVSVASAAGAGVGAGAGLSATYDAVRTQVGGMVSGAVFGAKKDGAINNMKGFVSTGSGKISGAAVDLLFAVVPASSSKVIVVISIGVKGKYEQYAKEMQSVLFSVTSAGAAVAPTPGAAKSPGAAPTSPVDTGGYYDAQSLANLPEDARKAAIEFARGVSNWDDPATPYADGPDLLAGFIGNTVRVGKKNIKRGAMTEEIAQEGPGAWAQNHMQWMEDSGEFHAQLKGKAMIHVFRGSGYGATMVAILKKAKRWQLVEIKQIDLGSP